MKDYIVDLTDGTRLPVNVNFGTLYYLQKMPKFYKLAKKKQEKLTDPEKMDLRPHPCTPSCGATEKR